jgi:hypothetical protein
LLPKLAKISHIYKKIRGFFRKESAHTNEKREKVLQKKGKWS